ncbi:MAG: hypothetical protein DHS20C15_32340 [Planctomycetota bacterium]|nr:MAG: hypothetical protein DHS20C15_32340 [Planctomycetota bacterium]
MQAKSTADTLRPPLQERSRASTDRVLAATEELLTEKLLEEVTLAEILERAGVSVGAFYARFGNRDGLVPPLHDRYDERVAIIAGRVLDPARWAAVSLEERVRSLVRYALTVYRRNHGLLRALVLEWRLHPERITDQQRQRREVFFDAIANVLIGDGTEINHPDPRAAARFAFLAFGAVCRELLLQGRVAAPLPTDFGDDRALAKELSRNVLAHLTYAGPPTPGA